MDDVLEKLTSYADISGPRRFSAVMEIYSMPFPWKLFPPWKYPNSVMYTLFGLDLWLRVFVCSSTLLQEAAASGARRLVNYWSDTCRKRNMRKRPQRHRSACTTSHRVRAVLHCNTPHNNRDSKQRTIFFRGKRWAVCTCVESELQDLALRPGPKAMPKAFHSYPQITYSAKWYIQLHWTTAGSENGRVV